MREKSKTSEGKSLTNLFFSEFSLKYLELSEKSRKFVAEKYISGY